MNFEFHFLVTCKIFLSTMSFELHFVDFAGGNGKCCGQPRMRETFCLSCAIGPSRLPVRGPKAPSSEPQVVQPRGPQRKKCRGSPGNFCDTFVKNRPVEAPEGTPPQRPRAIQATKTIAITKNTTESILPWSVARPLLPLPRTPTLPLCLD